MESNKPIRIFIADDHPLLRMGLRLAFNAKDNIEVIGEANNGFDAIDKIKQLVPDVALFDIDMPGLSGTAAIRVLRKIFPVMKILVLSTYNDVTYIRESMSAGANGYLLKTIDIDNLVKIITSLHLNEEIISPYLMDLGIDNKCDDDGHHQDESGLTNRERQILSCLAEGKVNKEISASLFLSVETVKTHLKNIFGKLNAKSRLDAVMKARKIGILP
jgi:DNA-binding NarL/FixJ family response regulator